MTHSSEYKRFEKKLELLPIIKSIAAPRLNISIFEWKRDNFETLFDFFFS